MSPFHPSGIILKPLVAALALSVFLLVSSCSNAGSRNTSAAAANTANTEAPKGATIDIVAGGPADTVRAFYAKLRDKKFREAMFLTNMRPAIEGLTDAELKDFSLDFENVAGQVPAEIEINGEIVSGDRATVTVNLPKAAGQVSETQTINLRRENGIWVLLSVDEQGEKEMRAEGKQYFYNLRIYAHHGEAEDMLQRINKGQLVYSAQNAGVYADLRTLVGQGLVPDDVMSNVSTGYNYAVTLSEDKKKFFATATPAEYGKSGKLSFLLDHNGVSSRDAGGKPYKSE